MLVELEISNGLQVSFEIIYILDMLNAKTVSVMSHCFHMFFVCYESSGLIFIILTL